MAEFDFIRDLSESRLVPDRASLRRYTPEEVVELGYLYVISLRIMLVEPEGREWARQYCRKTARATSFEHWRSDANDLYVILHALADRHAQLAGKDDAADIYRDRLGMLPSVILRWLHAAANHATESQEEVEQRRRVFARMDTALKVNDASLRALRRLVAEWDDLKLADRRLAMTRLLQFLRSRARKGDFCDRMVVLASRLHLELHDVENKEECREERTPSLLSQLATESATAGATGAASIAAVPGGIGSGFDTDYSKSVYSSPTEKPVKKKLTVISRSTPN